MKQETKEKEMPIKDYDKTDRNFLSTDEDVKNEKKEKAKLQPEKFPVEEGPVKNSK